MDFREFTFRDCPKRGTNNALSANLDVLGGKNGSKSAVLVLCKATGQAPLTLFRQSRKWNSPKFGCASLQGLIRCRFRIVGGRLRICLVEGSDENLGGDLSHVEEPSSTATKGHGP